MTVPIRCGPETSPWNAIEMPPLRLTKISVSIVVPTDWRSERRRMVSIPNCNSGAIPTPKEGGGDSPTEPEQDASANPRRGQPLPLAARPGSGRHSEFAARRAPRRNHRADPASTFKGRLGNALAQIRPYDRARDAGDAHQDPCPNVDVAVAIMGGCAGDADEAHRDQTGADRLVHGKLKNAGKQGNGEPCPSRPNEAEENPQQEGNHDQREDDAYVTVQAGKPEVSQGHPPGRTAVRRRDRPPWPYRSPASQPSTLITVMPVAVLVGFWLRNRNQK